jgi:hypothetical protein
VDTETDDAPTGTLNVCDAVGNCSIAGPIGGNRVDKKAPVITILQPAPTSYAHSATLVLNYTVTDNGIGVDGFIPTMNGTTTLAGHGLQSGQSIYLQTELPLGDHDFSVNATDLFGHSSVEATTFQVIATPQSIIDAILYYDSNGQLNIENTEVLLGLVANAKAMYDRGFCRAGRSYYRKAGEHLIDQQNGENVAVINVLYNDLKYLMRNCS